MDVGILHEAVAREDIVEPFTAALDHDALLGADVRYVLGHHSEKHDLLV